MAGVVDDFTREGRGGGSSPLRRGRGWRWLLAAGALVGASVVRSEEWLSPTVANTLAVRFDEAPQLSLPIEAHEGDHLELSADSPPGVVELRLFPPGVEPCEAREDLPVDPDTLPVAVGELRGEPRRQTLETVAEWTGTYRLVVRAKSPRPRGPILLTFRPPHPATLEEVLRSEAAHAIAAGTFLWRNAASETLAAPDFERALVLARAAGDERLVGWSQLGLGWAEPDWQPAVPHFEDALRSFSASGDRQGALDAHRYLGMAAANLRQPELVQREFEAALGLARELGDPSLAAELRLRWGRSLADPLRQLDEACGQLAGAAQVAAEIGDPQLSHRIELWWGTVERSRFHLDAALEHLEAALALAPTLYDRARTLNGLGSAYDDLGEYQKARDAMIQAVDTFETLHLSAAQRRDLANSWANLGDISQRLGDLPAMYESYQRARSRLAPDAFSEQARILRALAWAFAHDHRHQEALEAADEAIRLSTTPEDAAISRGILGEVLLAQADDDAMTVAQARSYLEKALADYLNATRPAPSRLARFFEFIGEANRRLRQFDLARASLERALALNDQLGSLIDIAFDHYYLARIERERGELALAQEHVQSALTAYQRLRSRVGQSEAQASFGSARPREVQEFYVDLLMERHLREPTAGFDRQAFSASEQARGQSLLDLIAQGRPTARDVPKSLIEEREAVRRALRGLDLERSRAFADASPSTEAYARWKNELVSRESQLQRIDDQIRRLDPNYDALVHAEPASVDEIQALLDEDTVLLEFLLGDSRSYLWVVTKNSLSTFTLSARRLLEGPALDYHRTLTRWTEPPAGGGLKRHRQILEQEANRLSAELGSQLLAQAGALLGRKRLAIVADGALEYIPFSALIEPSTGAWVIENHVVARLPSASVLAVQRRTQAGVTPTRQLALFADPVYLSLPPLAYTRQEAERIQLAATGPNLVHLGAAANREAALAPELADFRFLHFAVHGKIDAEFPNFSKLVLSEQDGDGKPLDGDLTLTDIYGLSLHADLVVLSACDTALGKNVRGEGLLGLTRGFLYAGAERVISTLWRVQDEATTQLMERFYRALLVEHLPPSDALRVAQNELRRDPVRKFPYYWAGFVLQGEWR